jgi:hypothetical protein
MAEKKHQQCCKSVPAEAGIQKKRVITKKPLINITEYRPGHSSPSTGEAR